jgi:hypothetical protein
VSIDVGDGNLSGAGTGQTGMEGHNARDINLNSY